MHINSRPWEIFVPCVKMSIKVRDIHEPVRVVFLKPKIY